MTDIAVVLPVQNVAWVENQGRRRDIRFALCEDIAIRAGAVLGRIEIQEGWSVALIPKCHIYILSRKDFAHL